MAKTGPSIAEVQDDLVMTANRRAYGYEVGEDGRLYAVDANGRVRIDLTLTLVSLPNVVRPREQEREALLASFDTRGNGVLHPRDIERLAEFDRETTSIHSRSETEPK